MSKANIEKLELNQLRHVHIVGVCGTLMGAFAAFLRRAGVRVTGSDQNVYPPMSDVLSKAGVELMTGYRAENVTQFSEKPDLVVIGNVIRGDNVEARAVVDGGFAYSSLPEAMEKLFLPRTRNILAAGTHGKTTTSSLLAHTLVRCDKKPSYFIGGVSQDLPNSFHVESLDDLGEGRLFVLEGDEYDTAFWDKVPKFNHYLPDDVILTSVEYDHADIYPDLASVIRAFEGLIDRIRPGGRLIACWDYPTIRTLAARARVPVISYGSPGSGALYTPGEMQLEGETSRFSVMKAGQKVAQIEIQLPGLHNVMNALTVWIECHELGIAPSRIAAGMASFRGVKRRQEVRGEVAGITVIDDFAHHPTAVRETLRALKLKYPAKRLVTVFEPRSATCRRKIFQKEFAQAFAEADRIWIASPYDLSRIPVKEQFSSVELVEDLRGFSREATLLEEGDAGVAQVARGVRPGDLVAVLSNGGFGGFIPKLLNALAAGR